jgi:4-aminobutyrate aminotransferase-like enzyme
VIWVRAEGCRVTLDDGRELLDLTGGFGVAALGHRNARILEAWREQEVVHALGDLADAEVTVRLREALPRPAKLGVTGEDTVEIALRTALLATGRPGIVAFDGCSRSRRRASSGSASPSQRGCPGRCTGARMARIPGRCPRTPAA